MHRKLKSLKHVSGGSISNTNSMSMKTLYAINGATCITSCTIEFIQRVSLNADLNEIDLYLWHRFSRFISILKSISNNLSNSYILVTPQELSVKRIRGIV